MRLVHHHKHIDLEKVISRRRGGVETPTSPFIVLRHAGKRLTLVTINSFFSDTIGLRCRHASRQNAQSQRWCWASVCQLPTIVKPPVAHSLQRASCLGVLPTWPRTGHVCVNIYLSFDMSICHRALRTFHPFPKIAHVNFLSHQPLSL